MDEAYIDLGALIISSFVTGLELLFNGLFLLAIIKRTPPPLKSYAVLLFNFALVDFLCSFGSLVTQQRLMFSGLAVTYIFNGACQFVHPYLCYFIHCCNCQFFAHSQWILLISFIYRYYILVNPAPEFKNVVKLSLLVYIRTLVVLTPYTLRNSPTEVIRDIMKSYPNVVVAGNDTALEWSCTLVIIYMVCPCPFVYSVILYYRRKTLAYLDEAASNLSPETKKQHKKMIKALTIQACVPIFYLGGAGQFALGQFHIFSGPIIEHGTFMSMEMMPMVTPLISLYFITPYRRAMLDWTGLSKLTKKPTSTVAPLSTVTSTVTADPKASLGDMA